MLLPGNIADDRMNIAAFSLHPLRIVFRADCGDNAVTALCEGTGRAQAEASAATCDQDRFCHANLTKKGSWPAIAELPSPSS
jgi:hypothetical protein